MPDNEKIIISGPVNVVRLEGKIGNISKILYIFMDIHHTLNMQTVCTDFDAVPFENYLKKIFRNPANKLDFFNEDYIDRPNIPDDGQRQWTKNYLGRSINVFNDLRKLKEKFGKFQNVRVHYFDFRFLTHFSSILNILNDVKSFIDNNKFNLAPAFGSESDPNILKTILDHTKNTEAIFNDLKNAIKAHKEKIKVSKPFVPYSDFSEIKPQQNLEFLDYYIDKIYNKYSNESNKNKILTYFHKMILPVFEFVQQKLSNIYSVLEKLGKKRELNINYFPDTMQMTMSIYIDFTAIEDAWSDCFVYFVDMFFLRRFIDKDYIEKCIIYCGGFHGVDYLMFLVRNCNFKITHVANSTVDIDKLNSIVKAENNIYYLTSFFLNNVQCSDLSHFPNDWNF
jgi:hypothetical protein